MWHCGSAPMELADDNGVTSRNVYRSEFAKGTELEDMGPITSLTYKGGPVTVFRLTGEVDSFYYFTGSMFEGKKSWYGNRGWVKDLKLYKEPIEVKDLINTILVNNIQHHYPMVLGDVSDYLEEMAYWLDLEKVPEKKWQRYLYK